MLLGPCPPQSNIRRRGVSQNRSYFVPAASSFGLVGSLKAMLQLADVLSDVVILTVFFEKMYDMPALLTSGVGSRGGECHYLQVH